MPVTFKTASHAARKWSGNKVEDASTLFTQSCAKESRRSQRIIQCDFSKAPSGDTHVTPSTNGLVRAIWHAYSSHHHLTLRPDDVWFAILVQLSFYITANAEQLRSYFVEHEGQKELVVYDVGTIDTVDFGRLAQEMTREIQKNVKDPDLREWVMPSFSTTTTCDKVVASILFMGAMQKYFSYTMMLTCGIPSVTLLGEKADWEAILTKIEKIPQLGREPAQWARLLESVLRHFILSFDEPTSPEVISFWGKCVHKQSMGSGPTYMCGWVTAFCFWDEDGKSLYGQDGPREERAGCNLYDVLFHKIDTNKVPNGYASVPVTVNDNGTVHKTTMVAGSIGIHSWSSGQLLDGTTSHSPRDSRRIFSQGDPPPRPQEVGTEKPDLDSIQPVTGWWMYEGEPASAKEAREKEKKEIQDKMNAINLGSGTPGDDTWEEYISLMGRLEELAAF
jgi:hypothetical protein